MPLSDTELKRALETGTWTATRDRQPISATELTINPNSINLSLARGLLEIMPKNSKGYIDLHEPESMHVVHIQCGREGQFLEPERLYLASVREAFNCSAPLWIPKRLRYAEMELQSRVWEVEEESHFMPCVEGRSTVARVGLSVHECAGFGDAGFSAPLHPSNSESRFLFAFEKATRSRKSFSCRWRDESRSPTAAPTATRTGHVWRSWVGVASSAAGVEDEPRRRHRLLPHQLAHWSLPHSPPSLQDVPAISANKTKRHAAIPVKVVIKPICSAYKPRNRARWVTIAPKP